MLSFPHGNQIVTPKRLRKTVLNSEAREFVVRLRDYFAREQQNGGPLLPVDNVRDRVADALGIGKATVSRITKEKFGESSMEENKLSTPKNKKHNRAHPVTNPDDFDMAAIRNHIYAYYLRGELPTCKKLLASLKSADLFKGGGTSLRVIIKNCGFRYGKCDKRKVLMERKDIALMRCDFLRKIKNIDNWDNVVYLDETWLNANHTVPKAWTDDTEKSCTKAPEGKGQRLIICHAGTAKGFVPNCLWAFKSVKTTDYHEEMNFENFKKWFIKLLDNLYEPHHILMDNAPYHSVQVNKAPTSNNNKGEIIEWLQRNGVAGNSQMLKKELVRLLNLQKLQTKRTYFLDEMAKSKGHTVIRLPPYHCQYNAIEMIWAQIKGCAARLNTTPPFTANKMLTLLEESCSQVTPDNWRKVVDKTKKLCFDDWDRDVRYDSIVDQPFLINVGDSSCSSDSESETQALMSLSDSD